MQNNIPLVLASQSPNRRQLLAQLGLAFEVAPAHIDETPHTAETPDALVKRLSIEKAKAMAKLYPKHLIIGSDQIALLNGQISGKPGNHDNAKRFLLASSGQCIEFVTGLAVLNSATDTCHYHRVPYRVWYRSFDETTIDRYLAKEQPFACAGALKYEGLGITLIAKLEGDDPNALLGLPLIALTDILAKFDIELP